jgi:hypothetical protein
MAAEVRRLLAHWGYTVEDRRLTLEDLLASDHVLLTNSVMGAVPALSLNDAKLGHDPALCDRINAVVFLGNDAGAVSESVAPPPRESGIPGADVQAAELSSEAVAASA